MNFCDLPLEELVGRSFVCDGCGQVHASGLTIYRSGAGVVYETPNVLKELGFSRPFVVCDKNTYEAAGKAAASALADAGIAYELSVFPTGDVEPDEWHVGALTMAFNPECDCVLAVGSGVINDVCKVVARAFSRPSVVIGTAPSMDGYASNSSSMHVNGVKTTLYNACPVAVLCDTEIVRDAPMRMLWAGLGDMLAKYVSLCEWRISNLITGEYYCEQIAALVRRSLKKCLEGAEGLINRDASSAEAVFEGLTASGVAMAFARSSRPASGIEHYFSHLWEMMAMERGTKADLHGIQVGVGTLQSLKLYEWVRTLRPDRDAAERAMAAFSEDEWESEVRRIFGKIAPQIFEIEKSSHKNAPERQKRHIERIVECWDDILQIIAEELPPALEIEQLMIRLGMPKVPSDLGIPTCDVRDAFVGSRDIRDKYILSSLMFDMGLLSEAAGKVNS